MISKSGRTTGDQAETKEVHGGVQGGSRQARAGAGVDPRPGQPLGCGRDGPESGFEALYQIATGAGIAGPIGGVSPVVAPFAPAPDAVGSLGGVGFRDGALPIVIHITDALSHKEADYDASSQTGD